MTAENGADPPLQQKVQGVLVAFEARYPMFVRFQVQPRMVLHDGMLAIPDFALQIDRPGTRASYIIECQDGKQTATDILCRFDRIKAHSSAIAGIAVRAGELPGGEAKDSPGQGVMEATFQEFVRFVERSMSELETVKATHDSCVAESRTDHAMPPSIWDAPISELVGALKRENRQRYRKETL